MTAIKDTPYGRIYCITNAVNGKQYVGKTTRTIARRFAQHIGQANGCRLLARAIRKYTADSFSILELCSADSKLELDRCEKEWIARLGTVSPKGYNLSAGGNGAGLMHEETKALLRAHATKPERMAALATLRTPEIRARAGQSLRKFLADPDELAKRVTAFHSAASRRKAAVTLKESWASQTDEQRQSRASKISVALTGKKGTSPSAETRALLSAAVKKARQKDPSLQERLKRKLAHLYADPVFLKKRAAAVSKGHQARRAASTHCKNGHERTPNNVVARLGGVLRCKKCELAAGARHRRLLGMKVSDKQLQSNMTSAERGAAIAAGKAKKRAERLVAT